MSIDACNPSAGVGKRTLAACSMAHVLHDGFSDLLFVLFPIWQAAFGLSFAQVGMLKMLYSGTMAVLQVPASLLAERFGARKLLALGTLAASCGFILSGYCCVLCWVGPGPVFSTRSDLRLRRRPMLGPSCVPR